METGKLAIGGKMSEGLKADLVFEGGGMKGIGLVGALSVIEESGYEIQRRAGSSAGAVVAALHAAGYTAEELYEAMIDLDFAEFLDLGWEDRIPLVGVPLSIIFELGIYEGHAFERWLEKMLAAKGVRTFADLVRDDSEEDERFRWSLQVVVSDITTRSMLLLPRDSDQVLGVRPDDLSVAAAVRASMSIPVFFEPMTIRDERDHVEHLLVDGGMLSNFPVWVFDEEHPRWPTIGLLLVEGDTRSPLNVGSPDPVSLKLGTIPAVGFAVAMVQTMMEAHDRLYIKQADFARTIPIETIGVSATDFTLSRERKEALYQSGREAAREFLPFDFSAHRETFRRSWETSRSASVARQMQNGE